MRARGLVEGLCRREADGHKVVERAGEHGAGKRRRVSDQPEFLFHRCQVPVERGLVACIRGTYPRAGALELQRAVRVGLAEHDGQASGAVDVVQQLDRLAARQIDGDGVAAWCHRTAHGAHQAGAQIQAAGRHDDRHALDHQGQHFRRYRRSGRGRARAWHGARV
jgi:hypothetical protein